MISNSAGGALDKWAGFKAMHDMVIFVVICDIAADIAIVEASQATPRVVCVSCELLSKVNLARTATFVSPSSKWSDTNGILTQRSQSNNDNVIELLLSSCQDRPRSPLHSNQYFVVFLEQIYVHLQYRTSHKSNPTVRNNLCPPPRLWLCKSPDGGPVLRGKELEESLSIWLNARCWITYFTVNYYGRLYSGFQWTSNCCSAFFGSSANFMPHFWQAYITSFSMLKVGSTLASCFNLQN